MFAEELERNQETISELTEKLSQLTENNFELATELENEELKQKTCSSDTLKIFDTLIAGEFVLDLLGYFSKSQ